MKENIKILLFHLLNEYPQIVMTTEEGIYFEANILKGLELYDFPKTLSGEDFLKMVGISVKCCAAFVKAKPQIMQPFVSQRDVELEKEMIPFVGMIFYHSSVIKMVDELSDGSIGVRAEIERLEKIWREKGVDELIASAEMAEAKTPKEVRELLDFYVTKIAPVGECII